MSAKQSRFSLKNHHFATKNRQFTATNAMHQRRRLLQGMLVAAGGAVLPQLSFAQSQWLLPHRANKAVLPLHYNENSMGMSPKALSAAQAALASQGNRYPVTAAGELQALLAAQNDVSEEQVLLGNGSSQLLGAIVALMAKTDKNTTIVEPAPTFGGLRGHARTHGLNVVSVPVGKGFVTDIATLRAKVESITGTVLVNICNPNNPTGTIVNRDTLNRWIDEAPDNVMFLLDEAYFEYAAEDENYQSALVQVQQGKENLFVTRTFSKIYGMAGIRVGYGFAAPKTAAKLKGFTADWNINIGGIAAATASIQDKEFYLNSLRTNNKAKAILLSTLDELQLEYIPCHTNFVLHRIGSDLHSYNQKMLANNIKVGRRMTTEDGWNRLSIGTPQQMLEFTSTLKVFREKGWV